MPVIPAFFILSEKNDINKSQKFGYSRLIINN
jgi:hypothetical protein